MSVTREVTVWCDGPRPGDECGEWQATSATAGELRQRLSRRGWLVSMPGGRDMCPDCVAEVAR